jgi:hypothetical protein
MKRLAIICLASLVAGCAFSAVNQPSYDRYFADFPREKDVQVSLEAATSAAKSTLEAMGYEIQAVTPELGSILTKSHPVQIPAFCDCGTWNGAPVSGIADSSFKIEISARQGLSRITVDHICGTVFNGQNLYGATTRHEVYRCASRGQVEREFWMKLDQIMEARKGGTGHS